MREYAAKQLGDAVARLYVDACLHLPAHVKEKLYAFGNPYIIENFEKNGIIPLCQDTGMAVVYLEVGQDAHITGSIPDAINDGVRRAVKNGYLRSSIVADPLRRTNTGDNTPATIYTDIVPGDTVKVTVAPRGFGCENKARVAMLAPADGLEGVRSFVLETARLAVPDACPPVMIGVGIGGNFDRVAYYSKKAVLRVGPNPDPYYAALEEELFAEVKTFAIGVNIIQAPTHIAGLPCAVSIGCHSLRIASEVLA
ncbi:MAG: fumarate hydratase [Oscillospiraceae bacterium]